MLTKCVQEKNIKVLVKFLFPNYPPAQFITPTQERIVRLIAFGEFNRACINAMTRYGKSACVAMGVALYIWLHENKKVAIIAPQEEQASIIRNYIAELIISCPRINGLVDIGRDNTIERLKREASRKRWTFSNGCELRMISAHGDAQRIMGFGADLIIIDEGCLVSREAYAKIVRMLGDDPENAILIELSNPWNRDNKYYDHYVSGRFEVIHVGWETALKEGRITQVFIDEMRQELTELDFTVLYESNFPDQSEDSLIRLSWINEAIRNNFIMDKQAKKIISCDVAEKGADWTVLMWGYEFNGHYQVVDIFHEDISDPMGIANRINDWVKEKGADIINIDCIGIGSGVVSRVRELLKDQKKIRIKACHYGEAPHTPSTDLGKLPTSSKKRFVNKKAEQYFRLAELMRDSLLDIPENNYLKSELMKMKKDKTLSEKYKIVDPEDKSPDFCFLAGTKVLTKTGEVKIEKLNIGDSVITPFGIRKIISKSNRIVKEVSCSKTNRGKYLTATGSHKIYTNETFKYLKDFNNSDKLESGIIKWRLKRLLNIMDESIGFRELVNTTTTTSTMEEVESLEKRKHSIERYGKISIIKKFLKGMMFTTLMEIPQIMILKTLRLLKSINIEGNIKEKGSEKIENYTWKPYKKPKKRQKNGIDQRKDSNGIRNIIRIASKTQDFTKRDAMNVIKNMKQKEKKNLSSVQENAICNTIEQKVNGLKRKFVSFVGMSLSRMHIQKQSFVHQDVLHFPGGVRVYSIEVEKDHVYYADNILVSNSDALCYFTWKDQISGTFCFA